MSNTTKEAIKIFDTTLRDGEQSPGATMNLEEKIQIAKTLDNMGVDIIEAGFAFASPGDFEAVKQVAATTKTSIICSLARTKKDDIQAAAEATKPADGRRRIHTFISTSPIHMQHKLNMHPDKVVETAIDSVKYARNLCDDVEWSAEDATRTEHDFLYRIIEEVIKVGATTINIPDTVGYTTPFEYAELIKSIKNNVPNIDKAVISVHCHNDLGLAVANSLSAVGAGARQVECTINGLGERAGNAAMEEIVMAIKTRNDLFPFSTAVNTKHIKRASTLVSTVTGFVVQPNKAIVGANAFAHESGIHQDGMLKNAETYEIMKPEDIGLSESSIVMGKHSGRHAFKSKLSDLGIELGDNSFEEAFNNFKKLADKKKEIYDEDIIALIDENSVSSSTDKACLQDVEVLCGSTRDKPKATVSLTFDGVLHSVESEGDGPVDALFNAIKKIVPHDAKLELYQVHAVTKGTDAQAEVTVRLKKDGKVISGNGRNTDTLVASAVAYIGAVNKLLRLQEEGLGLK